jgi:hypothetical protein
MAKPTKAPKQSKIVKTRVMGDGNINPVLKKQRETGGGLKAPSLRTMGGGNISPSLRK